MTWIEVEGFEVYGDATTAGNDVEAAIDKRPSLDYVEGTGSPTSISLEVGEAQGFALTMPSTGVGQAYRVDWEFPTAYKVAMNASGPDMVVGMRVKVPTDTGGSTRRFWTLLKSGPGEAAISMDFADDGNDLTVNYSAGSTTEVGAFTPGSWHYIEIHFKAGSSADGGFVTIDVDEVEVISTGSVNTEIFFNTSYGIRFQQVASTGAWALDDVCLYEDDGVAHTGPIGDRQIHALVPTSDATPNDWTPSAGGDNFALIDEDELDAADYVDATVTADDDHYGLTTLSASAVECLQIDCECIAIDGTPTVHIGFDDGTADEADDGVIGTGSNTVVRKLFPDDPSGSTWTASSVNSVEATQRMTE